MCFSVWYEKRSEPCVSVIFCPLNIVHIPSLSENGPSDDFDMPVLNVLLITDSLGLHNICLNQFEGSIVCFWGYNNFLILNLNGMTIRLYRNINLHINTHYSYAMLFNIKHLGIKYNNNNNLHGLM